MNTARPAPLILGLPAMGVPAAFYARFADALAAATGAVVEFADLPGQGERPERARDGADFGYREIVEQELPAWVACRRAEHPGRPIVLLGHICYASGSSEPGKADPTLEQAQQRVDNYASGFLAIGARAVIAEAYGAGFPSYVAALFTSHQSVFDMWLTSRTRQGTPIAFSSVRTPGAVAQMDPDKSSGKYYRSIVGDPTCSRKTSSSTRSFSSARSSIDCFCRKSLSARLAAGSRPLSWQSFSQVNVGSSSRRDRK